MQHPLIKLQGSLGASPHSFSCFPVFPGFVYPLVSEWLRQSCLPVPAALLMHTVNTNPFISSVPLTQSHQSPGEALRDQWFQVSFAAHWIEGNLSLGWIRTRYSTAGALFHLPASSPSAHVPSSCNLEITPVIKDSPVQILSLPSSSPLKRCCAWWKMPQISNEGHEMWPPLKGLIKYSSGSCTAHEPVGLFVNVTQIT